jgi:hypothetical protein
MEPEGGLARTPRTGFPLTNVLKTCVAPALSLVANHASLPGARSHAGQGFFRKLEVEVECWQRAPVAGNTKSPPAARTRLQRSREPSFLPLFTEVLRREILRTSHCLHSRKFRTAPALSGKSSYVECRRYVARRTSDSDNTHWMYYGPSCSVGPPDRGDAAFWRTSH